MKIVYAQNHKMEIINLKPTTIYYLPLKVKMSAKESTPLSPVFLQILQRYSFSVNIRNVKHMPIFLALLFLGKIFQIKLFIFVLWT